jgi:hypothetical protein
MAQNDEIRPHGPWNKPHAPRPVNSMVTRPTRVTDLRNQFGPPQTITDIFLDDFGPNVVARSQQTNAPAYAQNASSASVLFPELPFGIESTSYTVAPANQPVRLTHASTAHSVTSAGPNFRIKATEGHPQFPQPYCPQSNFESR